MCVNVCVNKKSPAEAGDSVRGKNDFIITALNAGTTFFFAEIAIMPIIQRVIIGVGFLEVGVSVSVYGRVKLCRSLSKFPHTVSREMLP